TEDKPPLSIVTVTDSEDGAAKTSCSPGPAISLRVAVRLVYPRPAVTSVSGGQDRP
ncbi:hypothetical protein BaRGS_00025932, partial [Batillaria attramentaria]